MSRDDNDDGAINDALFFVRDDGGGVAAAVDVVGAGIAGDAFRRFEADIDMGGLVADSISSGSKIGCRILPVADEPPNDFESITDPPFPALKLLSHDKVRRRGALYSAPDASVRDDKKE